MQSPDGLDLTAFGAWAAANGIELVGPLSASRVEGGHSCLTYLVDDTAGTRVVVRRPPLGHVLQSAHDVVREHRIVAALQDTGIPVAPVLGVCDNTDVIGAPFFVMAFVPGGVLNEGADVPRILPGNDERRTAGFSLVDALAELHRVDVDEVGLGDLSRRDGYLDRQLRRWERQWNASKTRELDTMTELHEWLVANQPAPSDEVRIVHGDFRLGNALLNHDGTVAAMLDWELCTLGEPMADLAYLLRSWIEPGEPISSSTEPPTRVGGFPTRQDLTDRYAERTGRSIESLDYWMAFNAWRSAAIAEGVLRRYMDGNMGEQDQDLDAFRLGVEISAQAGLDAARG
ncbi:MAG: phosphotransferase family protein [Acidimicrobiales bacterium]